jgi:uncharacterized membrane protein
LFTSPTINIIVKLPANQEFSELYLLGPNHTFDNVPFNIAVGVENLVYIGVGNELGYSTYYTCLVKIGNQTDPFPNKEFGTPSTLTTLFEYKLFIKNGATWEAPLTFRVNKLAFVNTVSQLSGIAINGIEVPINEKSAWDVNKTGFYYNLVVELWIYNSSTGISQFHNRFVSIGLNMTQ